MTFARKLISIPINIKHLRKTIILIFCLQTLLLFSQEKDTLSREKFLTMVYLNQDESYITFTDGISRNMQALWFEARLSPNYFFKKRNRRWALSLNPQVQLRMLQKFSMPVLPPSYRININFYRGIDFWKNNILSHIFYDDAFFFMSLGHHSNGQTGNFYLDPTEKTVNTENGNFSTNFFRFGISSYSVLKINSRFSSIRELKSYVEIHPSGWAEDDLSKLYGFYRLFFSVGYAGPRKIRENNFMNSFMQKSRINLKAGWIFGSTGDAVFEIEDRLILNFEYQYFPDFFDEVAFFARFYRGQDYYNILFIKNITQLSFGITTNIISRSKASEGLSAQ